ncbi:hypothetical protein BDF22DRAFT_743216 [Syncephalis plumigaleata]|nr:hypothetical protein BDF22DRAFT_743216 [Syncephalis plumigaleata]
MFEDLSARLHGERDNSRNEKKDLDLVIFGATGFTGEFVAKEVWRTRAQIEKTLKRPLRWAIAGRSEEKLRQVLTCLKQQVFASSSSSSSTTTATSEKQDADYKWPHLLVADVASTASLTSMAKRARVVATCVGPYRLYGIPVLKACVEQQAHYLDITGEPAFILRSLETYNEQAMANGVSIVHACGYDSIPAEMGILKLIQMLEKQNAEPTWIESFYTFHSKGIGAAVNKGTYESLGKYIIMNEMSNLREIIELEQAADKKYPVAYATPNPSPLLPIRLERRFIGNENNRGFFSRLFPFHWTAPYPLTDGSITAISRRIIAQQKLILDMEASSSSTSSGTGVWATLTSVFPSSSEDESEEGEGEGEGEDNITSLLKKKQQKKKAISHRRKTPPPAVHYTPRLLLPFYALPLAMITLGWAVWITLLAQIPLTRRLLVRYPRLFTAGFVSSNGPSLESIATSGFQQRMIGHGRRLSAETSSDTLEAAVTVSGPNPGYPATAICLVQSAYVLLDRKEKKLVPSGVLTPGAAFWKTNLLDRLHENGIEFST